MQFVKIRTNQLKQMEKTGIYIIDVCSHSNNPDEGECKVSSEDCFYIEGECYSLCQSGSGIQALGVLQTLGEDSLWSYLEEKFYSMFNITSQKASRIPTTDKYWDCECQADYIQPASNKFCECCGTSKSDCPSSRINEVAIHTGQTEEEIKEEE